MGLFAHRARLRTPLWIKLPGRSRRDCTAWLRPRASPFGTVAGRSLLSLPTRWIARVESSLLASLADMRQLVTTMRSPDRLLAGAGGERH